MCTGDKMLGSNLLWTSNPSRGSSNTPSWPHATETGISSCSVYQFGPSVALPLPYFFEVLCNNIREIKHHVLRQTTNVGLQSIFFTFPPIVK